MYALSLLALVGAVTCAFLAGHWTGRDPVQYKIAGILLAIGVVLWFVTVGVNRATGVSTQKDDDLAEMRGGGPVN